MTNSWQPHDYDYLMSTSWQPHDNNITTTWQQYDHNMTTTWQKHENIISTKWQQHNNIRTTSWQYDNMTTTWQHQNNMTKHLKQSIHYYLWKYYQFDILIMALTLWHQHCFVLFVANWKLRSHLLTISGLVFSSGHLGCQNSLPT